MVACAYFYIIVIKLNSTSHKKTCKNDMFYIIFSSFLWPVLTLSYAIEWLTNTIEHLIDVLFSIHIRVYRFIEKRLKKKVKKKK